MAKRNQKNSNQASVVAHVKVQRGLDRKAFLETGGEICRWRGLHTVRTDKKKQKSKRECRGRWNG